jgi:hypothetical protein
MYSCVSVSILLDTRSLLWYVPAEMGPKKTFVVPAYGGLVPDRSTTQLEGITHYLIQVATFISDHRGEIGMVLVCGGMPNEAESFAEALRKNLSNLKVSTSVSTDSISTNVSEWIEAVVEETDYKEIWYASDKARKWVTWYLCWRYHGFRRSREGSENAPTFKVFPFESQDDHWRSTYHIQFVELIAHMLGFTWLIRKKARQARISKAGPS